MSIVVVNTEYSSTTLSGITDKHVQQAAVDISLENVWKMDGLFVIDEDHKQLRNTTKVETDSEGYYCLDVGVYEVSFDHDIQMGSDEFALIISRSTLIRAGLLISSGGWDCKFSGRGGAALHVRGGPAKIKRGTRVGQFVVWKVLNPQGSYQGDYGLDANGKPKAMEAKYHQ